MIFTKHFISIVMIVSTITSLTVNNFKEKPKYESDFNNSKNIVTNIELNNKESILDNYKIKWVYNTLSDNQKIIYELIYDGILNGIENINLSDFDVRVDEIEEIFWACNFDNPQILNVADKFEYNYLGKSVFSVTVIYTRNIQQSQQILMDVESRLNSIIVKAKELSNDYERIKYFHDWIVNNTIYIKNNESYISEIDGPVIYGKALCEGYSKTFEYLCQSVGIPCICIRGIGNSGNHMWNMVQLNNNWYHVDVTWDDPITTSGKQICRYTYFLLNDTQIKKTHIINNYFKVPNALNNYQ